MPIRKKSAKDAKKFPKRKLPMGRPRTILDEVLLAKLAESMLPVESIATILECDADTIYANYSGVLQRSREGRKQKLSIAMWEKALIEKDTKMMIWLSKQHLGYKDVVPESAQQINFNVYCNEVPFQKGTVIEVESQKKLIG